MPICTGPSATNSGRLCASGRHSRLVVPTMLSVGHFITASCKVGIPIGLRGRLPHYDVLFQAALRKPVCCKRSITEIWHPQFRYSNI